MYGDGSDMGWGWRVVGYGGKFRFQECELRRKGCVGGWGGGEARSQGGVGAWLRI